MNTPHDPTMEYLTSLAEQRFWGTLTFKLQDGVVIHVTEERSLKPNQLIPEYRRTHEYESR